MKLSNEVEDLLLELSYYVNDYFLYRYQYKEKIIKLVERIKEMEEEKEK